MSEIGTEREKERNSKREIKSKRERKKEIVRER